MMNDIDIGYMQELIDEYWEIAWTEGDDHRHCDTKMNDAQSCRSKIEGELDKLKSRAESGVERKWINCSVRLPTEDDADCKGEVWVCEPHTTIPIYTWDWWQLDLTPPGTLWMPTGLKRPQPSKQEKE
jgi:hypothetical protein